MDAMSLDPKIADRLKRYSDGLVAAIAQQYDTGEVLMLAWMDDEALHRTLTTGRATYWSRSRQEYWVKGDSSCHQQWIKEVALDCDGDAVLLKVDQIGAACHTGDRTCWDTDVLEPVVGERPRCPAAANSSSPRCWARRARPSSSASPAARGRPSPRTEAAWSRWTSGSPGGPSAVSSPPSAGPASPESPRSWPPAAGCASWTGRCRRPAARSSRSRR